MKITIEASQDYLGSLETGIAIDCDNVFELENIVEQISDFLRGLRRWN